MDILDLTYGLSTFIANTPTAYNAAQNISLELDSRGFTRLSFADKWQLTEGKGYYLVLGGAAVVAFKPKSKSGFMITASHTDSPAFKVKPNPLMSENGCFKLNTEPYGGGLYYSWLDRPLSLAGRAVFENEGRLETVAVNVERDLAVIPSLAIHLNREANKSLTFNPQTELSPIVSVKGFSGIEELLVKECGCKGTLVDYDLYLYVREIPRIVGNENELMLSPRLDNLVSVYSSLAAFLENDCPSTSVFCAFNSEEIGSRTLSGAGSALLSNILSKICAAKSCELYSELKNSLLISADNAHALHPNYPAKSDPTNKVLMGKGVAIKHHDHYTTNAVSSAIFKSLCKMAGAKYQDFASRSDVSCGSTLGVVSMGQVSVNSVDIGVPQLAMHSAVETAATDDIFDFYKAVSQFYCHSVKEDGDGLQII